MKKNGVNFFFDRGEELCFECLFFLHAKLGTINIHRTGLSDISYYSPFSCNLNDIKF